VSEPGFYYINGSTGSRIEGIINYNEDVQNPADLQNASHFPADALRSGPEYDGLFYLARPPYEVSPGMTALFCGSGPRPAIIMFVIPRVTSKVRRRGIFVLVYFPGGIGAAALLRELS